MKKQFLVFIVLTWVLAACSSPNIQAVQETPSVTLMPTDSPQAEITPAPVITTGATESIDATVEAYPPQESDDPSGVVTYALVPEDSSVTYEVGETFFRENNRFNVAVGTADGVSGDIQIDYDRPQESSVGTLTVDISAFQSDSARRDGAIRDRFLQSSSYPQVTYTPTAIEGLPETIEPGVDYPVSLQGDLTVRDKTRPASFDATVSLQGEALTGQATTTILMSDYGFGPIDILNMLKTEDQVKITVDFVALPK